jgi:GNAT superfamily N-acetyltransferase
MSVRIARAEHGADLERARLLMAEYIATLPREHNGAAGDHDVAELPGAYAPPHGRLLLAEVDGELAGCVALRPQGPGTCEMKRLYVRAGFRGRGVGRALIAAILDEARQIGYSRMRLDTLPSMSAALALYQAFGFRPTAPYLDKHADEALCFEVGPL